RMRCEADGSALVLLGYPAPCLAHGSFYVSSGDRPGIRRHAREVDRPKAVGKPEVEATGVQIQASPGEVGEAHRKGILALAAGAVGLLSRLLHVGNEVS